MRAVLFTLLLGIALYVIGSAVERFTHIKPLAFSLMGTAIFGLVFALLYGLGLLVG